MEAALIYYNRVVYEKSDPRVKTWTLMATPEPTLYIIALYLSMVLLFLPAFMKNRKPYNLTKLIRCYNIFQIVSCCFIIYMMATGGWITGDHSLGCQPIDYSDDPKAVRLLTAFYWAYFIKMTELLETVFFILRKKFNQVSALHIYHHASTFFLSYVGCKFFGGGMASLPVMGNSFIHIIMYTYYYLSSLGPKWQKTLAVWKPKLTIAQMIQFVLMLVHGLSIMKPGCKSFALLYVPHITILFKMFYDFYTKNYHKKTKQN